MLEQLGQAAPFEVQTLFFRLWQDGAAFGSRDGGTGAADGVRRPITLERASRGGVRLA